MKYNLIFLFATGWFLFQSNLIAQVSKDGTISIDNIRIRDPFVLTDKEAGKYYMYAQMDNRLGGRGDDTKPKGVEVYVSSDLENWTQPKTVLLLPNDFWGRNMVWAPEVHRYKNKYYLFVTITSHDKHAHMQKPKNNQNWPPFFRRGTQVFVSDTPQGPFKPFANKPHTPGEWMALDGTLWEEDGKPYMIFCHEWVEIIDGSIDYVQLEKDLSKTKGPVFKLFNASSSPWTGKRRSYVTDGCYLYRTKTGKLLMIWSSFGDKGYFIAIAESESGKLKGPWRHQSELLFEDHGGHGSIFTDLNNQLKLVFHQPNTPHGKERAKFFNLQDTGETLKLKE